MASAEADIEEIARILHTEHGCHAAIVYGSHARGDATAESDYDIAGFGGAERERRIAGKWRGAYLDVFIHPAAKLDAPDATSLYMRGGRVLFERDGEASRFLRELDTLHARGPQAISDEEATLRRRWAWKMLDRIARNDTEAHYRRAWLLMVLLGDWFELRGRWYEGPKAGLAWLASHEKEAYDAFARALRPGAGTDAVERLVEVVAGPRSDAVTQAELEAKLR